jgi:hypothetical protein
MCILIKVYLSHYNVQVAHNKLTLEVQNAKGIGTGVLGTAAKIHYLKCAREGTLVGTSNSIALQKCLF